MRVSSTVRDKFIQTIMEEVDKATGIPSLQGEGGTSHAWSATVEALARRILRHGTTYARLAEEECNGPPGVEHMSNDRIERWQRRLERKQERCERLITLACDKLADLCDAEFVTVFQGDPRGHSVRVKVPSGRSDHPEGGVCVPTS